MSRMTKFAKLCTLWKGFARDTRGNAAAEYVTIASGVAVFAIAAFTLAGGNLSDKFTDISNAIQGVSTDAVEEADSDTSSDWASSDNDSDSDFDDDSDSHHWG